MSRRSVWIIESLVTALVAVGLVYAANFRYAQPLVLPAPPTPDYAIQASIAYGGIALVLLVGAVLTLSLSRRPTRSASSVAGVATAIVATGIIVTTVAFLAAAPR